MEWEDVDADVDMDTDRERSRGADQKQALEAPLGTETKRAGRTHPGRERRDGLLPVVRHVDSVAVDGPCRLVVRVEPEARPHVLGELCGLFAREGLLHDKVPVLHEEVDVLSCGVYVWHDPPNSAVHTHTHAGHTSHGRNG